ncbi:DNA-cytosine methyltransferase [Bradyrhizobium oligotrophicum S58]|uniref:DNA-cytosine methyltransferase n=1 Tax=Bradyrhizobium oligotrophicum S58 TaxID=1245469 RepID=M4Z4D5_9BRAD|nr:DNA-cytosine methyltransferase [Bradyrhizobium oligotrophicum S58]
MAADRHLGIEVDIGVAETIELVEILMVQNGAEHASEFMQLTRPAVVQAAMRNHGIENVGLAHGNEPVPSARRLPWSNHVSHARYDLRSRKPLQLQGAAIARTIAG